jgi:hypothetical protein
MRTALVLVALALVAAPMPAAAAGPRTDERKEAKRLFEAPGTARVTAYRAATLEEVAAAAAAAGDVRPEDAEALVAGDRAESFAASTVYCNWAEWVHDRGIFPYRRWIVGQTYWCYYLGGAITYRTSSTAARVDGVCSGSNARDWKVSGGAGYSWVVVHHEADFSCATPWWYSLNDTLWMEPAFNSWGNTSMTRYS